MNENQYLRKVKDRVASLRDYRYDSPQGGLSPIEIEAARVNAATLKEDMSIGPSDPHPNSVVR